MPDIRQLTLEELRQIYRTYMREDFPLMELRPWFSIGRAWEREEYSAYGYYDEDRLIAYAAFYSCGGDPHILMDYLAVVPDLRGRGIGSSFLAELLPAIPDIDGSSSRLRARTRKRTRRQTPFGKRGSISIWRTAP